jgi:hypothetical protein
MSGEVVHDVARRQPVPRGEGLKLGEGVHFRRSAPSSPCRYKLNRGRIQVRRGLCGAPSRVNRNA